MLEVLRELGQHEIHLIISSGARATIEYEMGRDFDEITALAHRVHEEKNLAASVASGTFVTEGMIIAPCSIKTLAGVANSFNDNLTTRAADVCLKEGRRVVFLVRETPLRASHLQMMSEIAMAGGTILPPVPAFYHLPESVSDLIDHTVAKTLDQFGIHVDLINRWEGIGS